MKPFMKNAHVICAVGAGGKTTFLNNLATYYLKKGKKVALTTTTHIWETPPINHANFDVVGKPSGGCKISYPGDEKWNDIISSYDIVLVEADGSRRMPVKIPREFEPVIPSNTDEVYVIMGSQAIGRRLSETCHCFELYKDNDCIVTKDLLKNIAYEYYINPLSKKYPDVKFIYNPSPIPQIPDDRKILLCILASGFSRRFKDNKLLCDYKGKPLFTYMLDELINVKRSLGDVAQIVIVSQYDEIKKAFDGSLDNPNAKEGISSSIKIGTEYAFKNGFTDITFFLADMPNLPGDDIERFVTNHMYSDVLCSCMCADKYLSNPGIIRLTKELYSDLMSLVEDEGAMKIIKKQQERLYIYHIEKNKLRDIDTKNDLRISEAY